MEIEEETEFMGYQTPSPEKRRPRLLYTCGASFLTTACKAYQRTEKLGGPLGSWSRAMTSLASPIVHPLQHQWLSVLSFIDDQIIAVENTTVAVFPLSEHLFDKIDELTLLIEGLPELFDETVDRIPALIHQLPLFNWASEKLIMGLKCLVNTITYWNSSKEREITVDIVCNEPEGAPSEDNPDDAINDDEVDINGPSSVEKVHVDEDEKLRKKLEEDIREVETTCMEVIEVLEKMGIAEEQASQGGIKKRLVSEAEDEMIPQVSEHESATVVKKSKDSILDLFEAGWQTKPLGGKKDL